MYRDPNGVKEKTAPRLPRASMGIAAVRRGSPSVFLPRTEGSNRNSRAFSPPHDPTHSKRRFSSAFQRAAAGKSAKPCAFFARRAFLRFLLYLIFPPQDQFFSQDDCFLPLASFGAPPFLSSPTRKKSPRRDSSRFLRAASVPTRTRWKEKLLQQSRQHPLQQREQKDDHQGNHT